MTTLTLTLVGGPTVLIEANGFRLVPVYSYGYRLEKLGG